MQAMAGCKHCRAVHYCGIEHKRDDWEHHKKQCAHVIKQAVLRKPTYDTQAQTVNVEGPFSRLIPDLAEHFRQLIKHSIEAARLPETSESMKTKEKHKTSARKSAEGFLGKFRSKFGTNMKFATLSDKVSNLVSVVTTSLSTPSSIETSVNSVIDAINSYDTRTSGVIAKSSANSLASAIIGRNAKDAEKWASYIGKALESLP
jgi:hypothetical protein